MSAANSASVAGSVRTRRSHVGLGIEAHSNALEKRQQNLAREVAPDACVAHDEAKLADGLERHGRALVHAEELVRVAPLAEDGVKRRHVALHMRVAGAALVLEEREDAHDLAALRSSNSRRPRRASTATRVERALASRARLRQGRGGRCRHRRARKELVARRTRKGTKRGRYSARSQALERVHSAVRQICSGRFTRDACAGGGISCSAQLLHAGKRRVWQREVRRIVAEAEAVAVARAEGAKHVRLGAAALLAQRVQAGLVRARQVRVRINVRGERNPRDVRGQAHKVADGYESACAARLWRRRRRASDASTASAKAAERAAAAATDARTRAAAPRARPVSAAVVEAGICATSGTAGPRAADEAASTGYAQYARSGVIHTARGLAEKRVVGVRLVRAEAVKTLGIAVEVQRERLEREVVEPLDAHGRRGTLEGRALHTTPKQGHGPGPDAAGHADGATARTSQGASAATRAAAAAAAAAARDAVAHGVAAKRIARADATQ